MLDFDAPLLTNGSEVHIFRGRRFIEKLNGYSAHTTSFWGVSSRACNVPMRLSAVVLHSFTQLFTTVLPLGNRQACCSLANCRGPVHIQALGPPGAVDRLHIGIAECP